MVKPIYKLEEEKLQQQFIKNNEEVPDGWTEDLSSLDIKQESSEAEKLNDKIEKLQQELSNTQTAVAELYETSLTGGDANG